MRRLVLSLGTRAHRKGIEIAETGSHYSSIWENWRPSHSFSDLKPALVMYRQLNMSILPEHLHWIDAGGARRGNGAGRHGDSR